MSERVEEIATLYRELAKSDVYKHLRDSCINKAETKRRNASKSQSTAYGELKFADGIEWVLDHINQQQVIDKI